MSKLIYITHPSVQIDPAIPPQMWRLSQDGLDQAKKLMDHDLWEDIAFIYSSTEPKAEEVATLASFTYGIKHESNKDLGEADRTAKPFMPLDEYMQAIQEAYKNPTESIHGWETHHDMFQRNAKAIDEIKDKHADETIVIVGHGGAGTCVKCYVSNRELSFDEDPKQTGCYFIADLTTSDLIQDWVKY